MSAPPFRVAHLDTLERVPVEGDEFALQWLPVRATLGIEAFGTNAYVAEEAGRHVVEPHTEEGSDHQELYFVARGRARFTLAGEEVDAPAGTYVFLPDPAVHREAVAVEPGTTVLTFGAPEGRPYELSEWEGRFRADSLLRTDPAAARALLEENAASFPDSGGTRYSLACLEALHGDADAAIDHIEAAVRLRPACAEWAREDENFAALRGDERFTALITGSTGSGRAPRA